jgi:SAM-dependent methyltransferase
MLERNPAKPQPAKTNFDHIYNCPDPQSYFQVLRPLDYRAPQSALPIFRVCIQALQQLRGRERLSILDICCGYGVNAALINHQLSMDDLYNHYCASEHVVLPLVQRLIADRDFFERHKITPEHQVVGIDIAQNALAYARLTGLMQQSFAADLERKPVSDALHDGIDNIDLIIVTGGLSYVGATTFQRLLELYSPRQQRPWIVCLPLRISDFQKPVAAFNRFGLRTEQFKSTELTFRQRRFSDSHEEERVLKKLRELKLDPAGKEAQGYLHGVCYISRPAADVVRSPLNRLI